jgi:hypothetical protein
MQCSYMKVPSKWKIGLEENVISTHKNLYSYELNRFTKTTTLTYSLNIDRTTDPHLATYCHVPLYNLCSYSTNNISPFSELAFSRSFEAFQTPIFEAIVMYKRNDFINIYSLFILLYIIYFCLFVAAISTTTSNPASSRKLMIASLFFGSLWAYFRFIVSMSNIYFSSTTFVGLLSLVLPFITGSIQLSNYTAPPELRSLSILFLWFFIFLQLRIFKGVGIFIVGKIS